MIPAAGSGVRFGGRKAFVILDGKPLLFHSLVAFASHGEVREIVVVATPGDAAEAERRVAEWMAGWVLSEPERARPAVAVVPGGPRRQDSVELGLRALTGDVRWALVHDAARPLVGRNDLDRLISAVKRTGAAVLGHPSTDSLKVEEGGIVHRDLPRGKIWAVQTPQGASLYLLKRAFAEAKRLRREATDEVGLLTASGIDVELVEGSRANIKVTFPEDLAVAEFLLKKNLRAED